MAVFFDAAYELLFPMWVEVSFLVFFLLGFLFLRIDKLTSSSIRRKKVIVSEESSAQKSLNKKIEADFSLGRYDGVVATWREVESSGPSSVDALKHVAQAFISVEPNGITEIIGHVARHQAELAHPRVAACTLDVIARSGQVGLMEETAEAFKKLGIPSSPQICEVLLGGYAAVGDTNKVNSVIDELNSKGHKPSARGYSLAIKGLLKNGLLDAALALLTDMRSSGLYIPSFALTQLLHQAGQAGRISELFQRIKDEFTLPAEAVVCILEDCVKRNDMDLARQAEQLARHRKVPLLVGAYDALLKLNTVAGDSHALELFQEMQKSGCHISEGLCVGLLARCADKKLLSFADEIVRFARGRGGMTVFVYSALMKVYAHSGLYDKACDLYEELTRDGLEPDSMMYGCLMKFAAECGRTELSRQLSQKAPSLDIQNYMSLIRAAGRDRDVNQAFAVLKNLKDSGVAIDVAAYNCVLDVCVSTGEMERARSLTEEMQKVASLDVITYNTLLKGYCAQGNLQGAKQLLLEMASAGHQPNDISYNLILNAAVSSGNFQEAWNTIEVMQSNGFIDHYTVSIMMKATKKAHNVEHFRRTLRLLDVSGIKICSDEVMLNTVVEACTWHKECKRLELILDDFRSSGLRPSVSTYGSLIKAASLLQQVDRCWELWKEAVNERKMDPSEIAMGCMLDALVCNGRLEQAVSLFEQWKPRINPNTVMYSTLAKGFANSRQAPRAMALWHDMIGRGVGINTVVCNALIDAQARCGCIDEINEILDTMKQKGCKPDVITFSTVMKGYCVNGDLEKAFEVFRSTQKSGLVTDAIIYNTLLDGCLRHNRPDLADQLVEEMEKHHIVPSNFTLGILVKMYGRRHQLDRAFAVAESLSSQHGFSTNTQVKTCLIAACVNNRAIDRALELFENLKATSGPDFKAYGVLIQGCTRHRRLAEAAALVEDAYGLRDGVRGLPLHQSLESDRVEQLLRALVRHGMMQSIGVPLLQKLRVAKVPDANRLLLLASSGGLSDAKNESGDRIQKRN